MSDNKKNKAGQEVSPLQPKRRKSNLERLKEQKELDLQRHRTRKKKRLIVILSILLAALLLAGAIVTTVVLVRRSFSYETADLSKYIYISRDAYTNYSLDIFIDQVTDADVEEAFMQDVIALKGDAREDGAAFSDVTIGYGDVVYLWYRGYMLDGDGNRTEPAGTSNLHADTYETLEIGSRSFISGFESGLVGINPADYAHFTRVTEGTLVGDEVLYATMTGFLPNGTSYIDKSVRIDLSDPTLDETYGEGFSVAFEGRELGTTLNITTVFPDMPEVNSSAQYVLSLDFVATGDTEPVVVTTYFPYDYTEVSLAGKTVYFEVFIDSVVDYELPAIDDALIGKLGYTADELSAFEGETLVEKYRDFLRAHLELEYESAYEQLLSDAIWEHLVASAEVKRLPRYKVETYYDQYLEELNDAFANYGASYGYTTVEEFATLYLDIEDGADYKNAVMEKAKSTVTEELLLYYIGRCEGLLLTEEEKARDAEALVEEYLAYYLTTFEDMDRSNYETEEAYEAAVVQLKAEMLEYYGGEKFFLELANYNAVMDVLSTYPEKNITGRLK